VSAPVEWAVTMVETAFVYFHIFAEFTKQARGRRWKY